MFTGIVEELGTVDAVEAQADSVRLTLRGPLVTTDVRLGDSVAVNGCCLTVARRDGETFTADVMQETLDKTGLGALQPGDQVNLERAVTPAGRLGGHIVQGHVDGTGTVRRRIPGDRWEVVEVAAPAAVLRYLVPKGSVTVDGISLTVVEVHEGTHGDTQGATAADAGWFSVSLIPETLSRTTLGFRQPGDVVNLEVDVIAKYVEKMVSTR
ncbi:MAG TPA: riboflavin synthase [Marmoricola sp.]|jgi:riboflavin synthase|nr:riboflavin synthase [Marmoricola sp.]